MKKLPAFVILMLGLWVLTPSGASAEKPERGITVEMGFSLNRMERYHQLGGGPFSISHDIAPMYIPRIGYRFNSLWSVGVMYINCTTDNYRADVDRYNSFGAFVERNFFSFASRRLSFFADLQYLYTHTLQGENSSECGLVPGLTFHIPGSPVDIKLRYLFVGFNDCYSFYKRGWGGCLGRGNFILDAGLQHLHIGAALTF